MKLDLRHGDCVARMNEMPEGSIDAIVADPPYGIEFMGKKWDRLDGVEPSQNGMEEFHRRWLEAAFRVLKPGGVVKAFSASRTYHRLASAMHRVGFQDIRAEAWIYSSGFPKGLNVSKQIDKMKGAVREPKRIPFSGGMLRQGGDNGRPWQDEALAKGFHELPGDKPVSDEAKLWEGWSTALKPAFEPVIIGTKPA